MKVRAVMMVLAGLSLVASAHAGTVVYTDKTDFLAYTSATAEPPIPNMGTVSYASYTVGHLTFSNSAGFFLGYGSMQWSDRLPGNEIAINGMEHLDINSSKPLHALGFDFIEPQNDPNVNAAFADSTFTVTLLNGYQTIGWFNFAPPNDTVSFVGVWSSQPFTRVQIRETVGSTGNEFFGQFYTAAVPLPAAAWAGLALIGGVASVKVLRRRGA